MARAHFAELALKAARPTVIEARLRQIRIWSVTDVPVIRTLTTSPGWFPQFIDL